MSLQREAADPGAAGGGGGERGQAGGISERNQQVAGPRCLVSPRLEAKEKVR